MARERPSRMSKVTQGCLILADISGYTRYLTGVELEHSHDVLADLIGVLVERMRGVLHLAQLEGDAVFCYGHEGEIDGDMLVAVVESSYFAFIRRVRTIHRHSTCECNACQLIPRLNLKFAIHHGRFALTEVAGSRELIGPDVILVHRLLKNSVTERFGLRGYAFFTDACLRRFALDPGALSLVAHREEYEDIGSVAGYVFDLEARWKVEEARQSVYVPSGQGIAAPDVDVAAPPPVVWDYLNTPSKRQLWQGLDRVEQRNPRGARGIGTSTHCVHGRQFFDEEILDWKPFRYQTYMLKMPGLGRLLNTTELVPLPDGRTRISTRILPQEGRLQRLKLRLFRARLDSEFAMAGENLKRLAAAVEEDAARWSVPTHEPTLPSVLAARLEAAKQDAMA